MAEFRDIVRGMTEQRHIIRFVNATSRIRAALARRIFDLGHHAEVYGDLDELCAHPPRMGIIMVGEDATPRGVVGAIERISAHGIWLPVVAMDAEPRTSNVVNAIKAGALDYFALPLDESQLNRLLQRIETEAQAYAEARRRLIDARERIGALSVREREVLDWLSRGSSNKAIARELAISPRTVEIHRANMMAKLGAVHAAEAVRLRFEAQLDGRALGLKLTGVSG